ncbi:MAG: hypothetical protein JNL24_01185 [Bacteroidia bacterium]|nr:hypothetical protein [Bacteroidia bacterium]
MKRKTMLLFILVSFSSIAQETTDQSKEEKTPKNEIGFNTIPLIKIAIGQERIIHNRYNLSYKRVLNDQSALRFSFVLDHFKPAVEPAPFLNDTIFQSPNNSLVTEKEFRSEYFKPHLNIGYERRFGKKKLGFFYGADLTAGYYQKRSFKENYNLKSDTTATGATFWYFDDKLPSYTTQSRSNIMFAGLHSFFGARYPITKRMIITAQVGFDAVLSRDKTTVIENNVESTRTVNSFDFSSPGILSDVSIVYRF